MVVSRGARGFTGAVPAGEFAGYVALGEAVSSYWFHHGPACAGCGGRGWRWLHVGGRPGGGEERSCWECDGSGVAPAPADGVMWRSDSGAVTPGAAVALVVGLVLLWGALPALVDALAVVPGVGLVAVAVLVVWAVALVAIAMGR